MSSSRRSQRIGLGLLQLFVGVGGALGGVGLLADPTGGNAGIPLDVLAGSPFANFLVPGFVLFAVNGIGQLAGGVMTLVSRRRYQEVAVLLGGLLMVWIVFQVWWIGLVHWLQPLYFFLGVVELGLGLRARR